MSKPRWVGRVFWLLCLCLAAASTVYAGEDPLGPLIRAHDEGDDDEFATAAASLGGDPWLVVDGLHQRSRRDVAMRCARLQAALARSALERYAESAPETSVEARRALRAAQSQVRTQDYAGVVAGLGDLELPSGTVLDVRARILLASALYRLSRHADAVEEFRKAAAAGRTLGWLAMERSALRAGCAAAQDALDFRAGLAFMERSVALEVELGQLGAAARMQVDLAGFQLAAGDLDASLNGLVDAYERLALLEDDRGAGVTAVNAALVLARRGEYAPARDWLDRSRVHVSRTGDEAEAHRLATIDAAVLSELGEYGAAADKLGSLLAVLPPGSSEDRRSVLTQLAILEERADRLDASQEHAQQALVLDAGTAAPAWRCEALRVLALISRRRGDLERARTLLDQASHAAGADAFGEAGVLMERGHLELAAGGAEQALGAFRAAGERYHELQVLDLEADAAGAQALALLRLRRMSEAHDAVNAALAMLDPVAGGLSDDAMSAARARRVQTAMIGVEVAIRERRPEWLWTTLERWRARALLDALGGPGRVRGAGLPLTLAAELARITGELSYLRREQGKAREANDLDATREVAERVTRAQAGLAELQGRVHREVKRSSGVVAPDSIDAAHARAVLYPGEALVHYAIVGDSLAALVLDASSLRLVELGPCEVVISVQRAFEAAVSRREPAEARLAELRSRLVDRLGLDPRVRHVHVCPDGDLAYAAWSAMESKATISVVPSGTTLAALRRTSSRPAQGLLALGDPAYGRPAGPAPAVYFKGRVLRELKGTRSEIEAVRRDGDVVHFGAQATEGMLRAELESRAKPGSPRWRAVLLACHGLIDPVHPGLSALALTPAGSDDGFLTASEVFGLPLETDLFVASACESGRGTGVVAEGPLGLARAALAAGARSVLVTLWKVDDDATAHLVREFFARWRAGASATDALRRAQEDVRKQSGWEHPFYWAGWLLWGDGQGM